MNILIVGAGAVGQVYGYHFHQAGHKVSYLIKERHQNCLQQGMLVYSLNKDRHLHDPRHFQAYSLLTEWPDAGAHEFELVIITIPSNALRQLPFDEVIRTCGDKTPILMLQPSDEDWHLLQQTLPATPIAQGLISLIAYQTPLNDERQPHRGQKPQTDGIAYYLPPIAMPISCPDQTTAKQLAQLFTDSGIKAKTSRSAVSDARLPSAFLMTFLCSLEAADWSFEQLRNNQTLLTDLGRAQRFFLPTRVSSKHSAVLLQLLAIPLLRPWLYRLLMILAPKMLPLPLEAYLASHFRKVKQQTLLYMEDYIAQHPDKRLEVLIQRIN